MRTKYILGLVAGAAAVCVGMAACGGGADTPAPSTPTTTTATTATSSSSHAASPTTISPSTSASISKDRAAKIATDQYDGQVISVEPDHAQGRATWEVELENSRQGRIEVDIAKNNGDIVATEPDNDNG